MRIKQVGQKLLTALAVAAGSWQAQAGTSFKLGDEQTLTFNAGARYSYTHAKQDIPGGGEVSTNDPNLDTARLFFGLSLTRTLGIFYNTEWDGEHVRTLDIYGQFALSPAFNVWVGRVVSPSDRANQVGPYFTLGGGFWPCVSSRYGCNGGIFRARDDGVVVWGNVADGRLGYSVGGFKGRSFGIGALTNSQARAAGIDASGSRMVSARLQYDFWDKEIGYFSSADHLGTADILAVGVAVRYQKDGALTVADQGDYKAYNLDFQLEKRFAGSGAVTLEAAYYDYDTDDVVRGEQGKAYSAGAGYLFFREVGWGRFQPFTRWQRFNADNDTDTRQIDVGLNYVIDGHNAHISATYSNTEVSNGPDADRFVIALQLQY